MMGSRRVKSGCATCRIRRVKCDEGKPACHKCVSTGRRCDGYSSLPFSRRELQAASQSTGQQPSTKPGPGTESGLLSRLATDPAFGNVLDKRYFQFFRQRTVTSTNSLIDSRFWDRVVLQACHSEPSVKHAVLALSSWHQLTDPDTDPAALHTHRAYADKQYQLALEHARHLISSASSEDVDRVLIACVVFICFESVRGDFRASALHMTSGRAIARQHSMHFGHASRRNDLSEIEQAFGRLDLSAICFSDATSPYNYGLDDFLTTQPRVLPWEFDNLTEARATLLDLVRWLMLVDTHYSGAFEQNDVQELAEYHTAKQKIRGRIERWHDYFEPLRNKAEPSAKLLCLNLQKWYHAAHVILDVDAGGPETRWDVAEARFHTVVSLGEQIVEKLAQKDGAASFSYDTGYLMTTFLAATRCRHPSIRRRAIRVLRALPRQEGAWASIPAAAIAERWMEVEEEGLSHVGDSVDVPSVNRIDTFEAKVRPEAGEAIMVFRTMPGKGSPHDRRVEFVRWS